MITNKILDISLQNDINTFLYESLPMCIIRGKHNLYEWFLNHYVDLYLASAKKDGLYKYYRIRHVECTMYGGYSKLNEVISSSKVESKVINNKLNIVDFLKENINNDTYAIVFLNEWAIPHKANYHSKHWYHESLVYGYDDEKGVLYCISFNENQTFTTFEVDYHSFWDGFQLICNDPADIGEYQRYVTLLKVSPVEYEFDFNRFVHQLNNFINGTIDLVDKYNFDLIDFFTDRDDWEYSFGYKIYDKFIDIINKRKKTKNELNGFLDDFEFFEYFDFHILYEHKKIMQQRIEFINRKYFNSELTSIVQQYSQIVEAFEKLRLLNIKFSQIYRFGTITQNKIDDYANRFIDILRQNKEKEKELFLQIYTFISQKLLT